MTTEPPDDGLPARDAGRKAGQYGRTVVRRIALRVIAAIVFLVSATALLGLTVGIHNRIFLVAEVVAITVMAVVDRKVTPILDQRIRGVRGEQRVGAILDNLASDGWLTLRDASIGRGNIDHIVVGPAGVLTIETKSHRGRISVARLERRWLAQAYAERKGLEEIVGVPVADCLLVFSNAFLVGRPVTRQRGVTVLPARMLADHLRRRKSVFTPDQVAALHIQVSQAVKTRASTGA